MITEEIHLNHHLEKEGIESIETDLGEYIVQQRNEHHITL
jgi:L-lactate dehydrogenase complex protein LldF